MPRGVYPRKNQKHQKPQKAKAVAPAPVSSGDPEVLKLDELTLYKMRALDAEMKGLHQENMLTRNMREQILKQIDPKGTLRQMEERIVALTNAYRMKAGEYEALRAKVGEDLGIDMKKYAYDDSTGVLHDITAPPPGAPAQEAPQQSLPTEKPQSVQ